MWCLNMSFIIVFQISVYANITGEICSVDSFLLLMPRTTTSLVDEVGLFFHYMDLFSVGTQPDMYHTAEKYLVFCHVHSLYNFCP